MLREDMSMWSGQLHSLVTAGLEVKEGNDLGGRRSTDNL